MKSFNVGDYICPKECKNTSLYMSVVDRIEGKFVYFHSIDSDDDNRYYGLISEYRRVPDFEQLSLFEFDTWSSLGKYWQDPKL